MAQAVFVTCDRSGRDFNVYQPPFWQYLQLQRLRHERGSQESNATPKESSLARSSRPQMKNEPAPSKAPVVGNTEIQPRVFPEISIRDLRKDVGGSPLYSGFNLDIERNKITALFGPNGCGKSTLLNMIAGLTPFEGGSILFDGRSVKDVKLGFVFQNYRDALMPWLSARQNIAYPLKLMRMSNEKIQKRVNDLIEQFDISFDLTRYPYQMSGGQQQLVSILRALAPDPEVICLDEPFSALDYEMTLSVREMLQKLFVDTKKTLVVVSHDLDEAVWLADRVVLLTRRPTRVSEIVHVDLPRKRDHTTLAEQEFINLRTHALEVFQREVRK